MKRRRRPMMGPVRVLGALLLTTSLSACGQAMQQQPGPGAKAASLEPHRVIAEDGYRLPLRHWPAEGETTAVVLAVHGFNDHGASFEVMAESLTPRGIDIYAHDQRGFGTTDQRRIWPGHERLASDVILLTKLLRERHPDTPLYLLGKSMGAAVTILALTRESSPPVDGSVLIAPAVWGFEAMPWYQRAGLWLGVRLFPSASFSAGIVRRLGIEPTDDPEIKRQLAEDPLILRRARVDTLHGVSRAMDLALDAARQLPSPSLILYGQEDHIIPPEAICALLKRMPEEGDIRMVLYPQGYHMLTRYTGREQTQEDIAAWVSDRATALPSGHELEHDEARQALCDQ